MTIDEKLKLFYETTIWDANAKYNKIIDELKEKADVEFDRFKNETIKTSNDRIKSEINSYLKTANINKSKEIIEFKLSKNEELEKQKNIIFDRVKAKLLEYKKTEDYKSNLLSEICKLVSNYDEITMYFDISDEYLISTFPKNDCIKYEISSESILGGYKALIPSQNIIIDNSFKSRLDSEKNSFAF